MYRRILCTSILFLLTAAALCACGNDDSDRELTLDIQEAFRSMERWSGTAELTADYGQRVYSYTVSFSGTSRDGMNLTITAPEEVAGITASIKEGQTVLSYDGIRLETGPLNPEGMSPLDAIPAVFSAMQSGYIAETSSETLGREDLLRISCRDAENPPGEGVETVLWFHKGNKALQAAEIRNDGFTVVRCRFFDVIYA